MSENGDELSLEIASTVEDHAAFLRCMTRRPRRLALHAGTFVLIGIGMVLMQLAIGLLGAAFVPHGHLAGHMRTYLEKGFPADFASIAPWAATFLVLLFALNVVVFTPRQCRLIATRLMAGYPGRSLETGQPVLVGQLTFDARGIRSVMTDERVFVAWPLVRGMIETKRHIFLTTSWENGLVIPKSGLDPALLERLRRTLRLRLGQAVEA